VVFDSRMHEENEGRAEHVEQPSPKAFWRGKGREPKAPDYLRLLATLTKKALTKRAEN